MSKILAAAKALVSRLIDTRIGYFLRRIRQISRTGEMVETLV